MESSTFAHQFQPVDGVIFCTLSTVQLLVTDVTGPKMAEIRQFLSLSSLGQTVMISMFII
jgi:hypothetical protein